MLIVRSVKGEMNGTSATLDIRCLSAHQHISFKIKHKKQHQWCFFSLWQKYSTLYLTYSQECALRGFSYTIRCSRLHLATQGTCSARQKKRGITLSFLYLTQPRIVPTRFNIIRDNQRMAVRKHIKPTRLVLESVCIYLVELDYIVF